MGQRCARAAQVITWTNATNMTTPRSLVKHVLLQSGFVLAAGGQNTNGVTAAAELYNPATRSWQTTAPMLVGRVAQSMTLLPGGTVLAAGGFTATGETQTAEVYDPLAGTWSATGSMAARRSSHTATLLPNNKVLIAGGYNGTVGTGIPGCELYDLATGTWTVTGLRTRAASTPPPRSCRTAECWWPVATAAASCSPRRPTTPPRRSGL